LITSRLPFSTLSAGVLRFCVNSPDAILSSSDFAFTRVVSARPRSDDAPRATNRKGFVVAVASRALSDAPPRRVEAAAAEAPALAPTSVVAEAASESIAAAAVRSRVRVE
jgi:hypothetical protein